MTASWIVRLVGGGDGSGEFLERLGEGAVLGFLCEERVHLDEDFFEKIFRRDALIVDAGEHVVGDLVKGGGDFVEAGDVVVVILSVGEAEAGNELGERELEAIELVDGHFPGLEGGVFLILDEVAEEEVLAEDFLV